MIKEFKVFKMEIKDQAYQDVKKDLGGKAVLKDDYSDMLEKRRKKKNK